VAEDFEMLRLDHTTEKFDRPVFESGYPIKYVTATNARLFPSTPASQ
jgi:hypothetical protein